MMPRKKKTFEYVIDTIKQMLIDGQLNEGQKLPNQTEFAQQLGVSRLALRQALHTLENMGVILQKPKIGTTILLGDPSKWVRSVSAPLLTDRTATFELIDARCIIEAQIARSAAKNITSEQIKNIEKVIIKMQKSLKDGDRETYSALDMEFHQLLAKAGRNRYIMSMFMTVIALMRKMIDEVNEDIPKIMEESNATHIKVFEAIKNGDEDEAVKWQITHIRLVGEFYNKYYHNQI